VSASAGFSGWGFSAEVSGSTETKTFSSTETSSVKEVEDTYTCPAGSSIFVYKRRYNLRSKVWFLDDQKDAWLEVDGRKLEGFFVSEITANQELISPVALGGQGKITNSPPADLVRPAKGHDLTSTAAFMVSWSGMIRIPTYYELLKKQYPWIA
jgi:hypothetical protein